MTNQDSAPRFNPPPGWPKPPAGWRPPAGWNPDPSWPSPPEGWSLWVFDEEPGPDLSTSLNRPVAPAAETSDDGLVSPLNDRPRAERRREVEDELEMLRAENRLLRHEMAARNEGKADVAIVFDDASVLQSAGIYRYHHPLENAAAYKARLADLESRISAELKFGRAIERSSTFTFNNSVVQGDRLSSDLSRLMLRAYNAEADNCIRSLKAGALEVAKRRLERCRDSISKLGSMMEIAVSDSFHSLRVQELELTADYLQKKLEEREAAREERARLREERKVERELAEQRANLEKERSHLQNALAQVTEYGENAEALLARLKKLEEAIEENDFRSANIRAGYVYIISNTGAFGEGVVKIGLTRRLDPRERVSELSGASVPFKFDVHSLYFSEDAVSLESELHQHFADRALNRANSRKEFFFATPAEVRDVLMGKVGNLLEFKEKADADEYFQSVGYWPRAVAARPIADQPQ